tara:strand:- start:1135 stop:1509 length:375 start_codon:yes stop_codon:yes gene_type:complete
MFQFPKKQKLCSDKSIENLFAKGIYISEQSFRLVWKFEKNNDQVAVKSLIIVPKKNIKLAKDRNIIKRRIKEAYRLQKNDLEEALDNTNKQLNLAIIYQYDKLLNYNALEQKIILLLKRLINEI